MRARGRTEVQLTWATRAGPKTITRPLRTLGAEETLFFFGLYSLIGVFVVWSGLAVVVLAGRRAGAAAYAGWSVSSFVFMVTFFDYHSTAVLSPLFSLSTVCVCVCLVWMAYSFPEPPRKRRRAARGAGGVHGGRCGRGGAAGGGALPAPGSTPASLRDRHHRVREPGGAVGKHPDSAARGTRPPPPGAAILGAGAGGRAGGAGAGLLASAARRLGPVQRAPGAAVPGAAAAAVRRLLADPPQRPRDQRRADAADIRRAGADQRAGRGDRRVVGAARGGAQRRLDHAGALGGRRRDAGRPGGRRLSRQQPPVLRGDRPLSPDAAAAGRRSGVEGERDRSGARRSRPP